jgi:hypothetical protein
MIAHFQANFDASCGCKFIPRHRLREKHTVCVKKHTMPKAISSWLCVAVARIGTGKCTIIYLCLANKFMLLLSQVPLHLTGLRV